MNLPPFPVDDATLDMLSAALDPRGHGDETAERSCLGEFLEFMSEMAGSDTTVVVEQDDDVSVMRDPQYSPHCLIAALVAEIRRLRGAVLA